MLPGYERVVNPCTARHIYKDPILKAIEFNLCIQYGIDTIITLLVFRLYVYCIRHVT